MTVIVNSCTNKPSLTYLSLSLSLSLSHAYMK